MIDLRPHNLKAYNEAKEILKTDNRVAIVQATGTGKSYILAQFVEDYVNKNIIVIAPTEDILLQFEKILKEELVHYPNRIKFFTYARLSSYYRQNKIEGLLQDKELIILDELHRAGAIKWGKAVENLLFSNPMAKVIGATATEVRYLDDSRNMVEELFHNNYASRLNIQDAILEGILPSPTYVASLYEITSEINRRSKKLKYVNDIITRTQLTEELNQIKLLWSNKLDLNNIFTVHLSRFIKLERGLKILVFCSDVDSIVKYKKILIKQLNIAFPNLTLYDYEYHYRNLNADTDFNNFKAAVCDNSLHLLFSVDKIGEGVHIPEVKAMIMFRKTESLGIYLQQIGRVLSNGDLSFNPVILDFVNNCVSLGNNLSVWSRYVGEEYESIRDNIRWEKKEKDREYIINITDYTKSINDVLNSISRKIEDLVGDWSIEMDNIVINYYNSEGKDIMKRLPNRTWEAIKIRASLLGVKRVNRWSEEEDNILREYYPKEGFLVEKRLPDRTPAAISTRVRSLGIRRFDDWSKEEDDILVEFYINEGMEVRKRLPGKGQTRIAQRARELGLRIKINFTDNEKDIIRKYYPQMGMDVQKLLPSRSRGSIKGMARKIGIKKNNGIHRGEWTEEEINTLVEFYPYEGRKILNRLPNRSIDSIRTKAYNLGLKFIRGPRFNGDMDSIFEETNIFKK